MTTAATISGRLDLENTKFVKSIDESVAKAEKFGRDASAAFEKAKPGIDATADAATRLGVDFTTVGSRLDSLMAQYKASTPENLKFAESIAEIKKRFDDGNISSQEAVKQLQAVKTQMEATNATTAAGRSPLEGLKTGFQNLTGVSLTTAGAYMALAMAIKETIQFFKDCTDAANKSNIELAKNEAILRSTGYAAGLSSREIEALSQKLSALTGVDDEAIVSAESMLLTFRNIGNTTFPRAAAAALDLQTTFGSLDSSATQLGKALNDPIKGVTALARSGVTFSEEQKRMIENFVKINDLASAQDIILSEVEHQVGGTAEAMNKASNGAANAENAFENLKEAIGQGNIPAQRQWNQWLVDTYNRLRENVEWTNRYRDALVSNARAMGISEEGIQSLLKGQHELPPALIEAINKTLQLQDVTEEVERQMMDLGYTLDATSGKWTLNADAIQADLDKMSEANQSYIDLVGTVQGNYESHVETQNQLSQERAELEQKRAELVAAGWSETSDKIKDVDAALAENSKKIKENADDYEREGWRIVGSILQSRLMADGILSDADAKMLLDFQEKHGIITEEMRKVTDEYIALANKEIEEGIPSEKTVYIDVVTRYTDEFGRRAVGAAPGRASGGPASGDTLVGEHGMEVVDLPPGSYVHDNASTMEMLRSAGKNETDPVLLKAIEELSATNQLLPEKIARAMRQNVKFQR